MEISKNRKYQYLFFFLITIYSIFNGGNSNLMIQLNFILLSGLYFFCLKDKNYNWHLKNYLNQNKFSIFVYLLFLIYLIFQIIPLPIGILKFFSFEKFNIIKNLNFESSFSSISLSPSNSFFQFLNFLTLFIVTLIIKMIFYTDRHKFRFYLFLSLLGAFSSFFAVLLYLNGNPDLFFVKSFYISSSTGFFINRTVFSIFLLFCLVGSLECLKNYNFENKKNYNNYFFKRIYIRLFIISITIGIITSFSRIGNFLLLITLFFYLIDSFYFNKDNSKSFKYIILFIILFDFLIIGFYFGTAQVIERFLFLNEQLIYKSSEDQSLSRVHIIYFGLENIKKFYLFGYGLGSFETLFQINYGTSGDKFANHAHSDLVEFFGELGFFGFILLILSIFKFFINKLFVNNLNFLLIFYLIIIILFDFSLHIPLIQILFIVFFMLAKKKL